MSVVKLGSLCGPYRLLLRSVPATTPRFPLLVLRGRGWARGPERITPSRRYGLTATKGTCSDRSTRRQGHKPPLLQSHIQVSGRIRRIDALGRRGVLGRRSSGRGASDLRGRRASASLPFRRIQDEQALRLARPLLDAHGLRVSQ